MISQISIRNFRSIASQDIETNWITTFVGANDAGKSNILRALNLFFNGETNAGERFAFSRDFNQFAEARVRRAAETEIRIRFVLPPGYQREGQPDEIEWKKVWRTDGEVTHLESRTFVGGENFPPRSKIPALLERIQFTYIPAIKDKAFFADMQGRLYEVLASVARRPLEESAGAFQEQLGTQLRELLESIQEAFGSEATMRLPDDLRAIFESLEINSGDVPLSRRGDGIKIRHIPMILRFIADKRDQLLTRGGVRYTHIWGFEEPENNVEMSAAFKMASELVERITADDRFQLFLTTHSPIFYRLDQLPETDPEWVSTHFVQQSDEGTKVVNKPPGEVDETMGLMPIIAPYVAEAKVRYDSIRGELELAQRLADQGLATVFVEGPTDERVLRRAWALFSGAPEGAIHICCGQGAYGGANALQSRALAWLLTFRHRPTRDRMPAVALFDADPAGAEARQKLGDEITRLDLGTPLFKSLSLPAPPPLVSLLRRGFRVPVDLEAYYPDEFWKRSQRDGLLEEVETLERRLSPAMVRDLMRHRNPFDELNEADQLRLQYRFTDPGKERASRIMVALRDVDARIQLGGFEPLIEKLAQHLLRPLRVEAG